MPRTRRIGERLARARRELQHTLATAREPTTPGLGALRDAGWHLIQLAGTLAEVTALLAEHTGHHVSHPDRLRAIDDGNDDGNTTDHLSRACRDLADLRKALAHAESAARDYYTALTHLTPTSRPDPVERQTGGNT